MAGAERRVHLVRHERCPACQGALEWRIFEQDGDRIEAAEAHCRGCSATYPVRDGIGLFLTPDLPRNDLWEQVESGVLGYLREHPEVERQLMDGPAEALAPAVMATAVAWAPNSKLPLVKSS